MPVGIRVMAYNFYRASWRMPVQTRTSFLLIAMACTGSHKKWWHSNDRQAYKNSIKDYRVIAIVTCHLHWARDASRVQQCWNGVTAVTVGAARLRFVLDSKIVDDKLTKTRSGNGETKWQNSDSIGQDSATFCGKRI